MAMPPTVVRCPGCDRKVQITPKVTQVALDASRLTVTIAPVTVIHHCGEPPIRTGFSPSGEGGPT